MSSAKPVDVRSVMSKISKKTTKSDVLNKQIVLNPFQTIYKMRVQRYKIYYFMIMLGILISLLQVAFFIYLYV